MSGGDSVKVAVRVRPFNQREITAQSKCVVKMNGNTTTIEHPSSKEKRHFAFDYSYWSHDQFIVKDNGYFAKENEEDCCYADQKKVFDDLGRDILDNAWEGYNATLFAYGQTGSGKSYSMIGYDNNKGIVPIACEELFKAINSSAKEKGKEMQITFSMLELYNERIRDLLAGKSKNVPSRGLRIREHKDNSFFVEGLQKLPCRDYDTIRRLMEEGNINRTTASTNMNATSSRSHMVITIKFKQVFDNDRGESTTKASEINLVDLAGSERAQSTGAIGDRLKEASSINTSLMTLGTVIKQLASGDSNISYRSSALTKLLKSALGGNSKTVMIAALSPADINYEETLSTLRYADQAKKIKNKAVINLSPTEKLIMDLKQENARLLKLLQSNGSTAHGNRDEVERQLEFNETQMNEMMTSWDQKLEEARKEWESEYGKTDDKQKSLPYFQNVNEDTQLSGVIKRYIEDGNTVVGKIKELTGHNKKMKLITFGGLGVQEQHCIIHSKKNNVSLEPIKNAEVIINGVKVNGKITLKHADRLKIGSSSLFLYIGFPHERSDDDITKKYNYDFFQNELASSLKIDQGLANTKDCCSSQNNMVVYNNYLKLMPLVSEANAIAIELKKNMSVTLIIKNLVLCDSLGCEKQKEVAVKLTCQETNLVWIWDQDEFINRKFLMDEFYQKFLMDPENFYMDHEDDPFWDPVQDIYLGCGHAWLQALAYKIPIDEKMTLHNHEGNEEGEVQINVSPCNAIGELLSDDAILYDPVEMKGKQFDMVINLKQCIGLRWVKEFNTRGIRLKYYFHNWQQPFQSKPMWHKVNPRVSYKQHITVPCVDEDFLTYLQTHALVVELWGLQEGRLGTPDTSTEVASITSHTSKSSMSSLASEASVAEMNKLRDDLNSTQKEQKELVKICKILKKENASLKTKLNDKSSQPTKNGNSGTLQSELGKALKVFFSEVKPVQQQLNSMKTSNQEFATQVKKSFSNSRTPLNGSGKVLDDYCKSQDRKLNEVAESLNASIVNLKELVASAVRAHRNEK